MIGEEKVSVATSSGSKNKMTGLITKIWGMKTDCTLSLRWDSLKKEWTRI